MAVDRRIRACARPGAWSTFAGERIKLRAGHAHRHPLPPGVLEIGKNHVLVGTEPRPCGSARSKAHGRKLMPAADWGRGARIETGAEIR